VAEGLLGKGHWREQLKDTEFAALFAHTHLYDPLNKALLLLSREHILSHAANYAAADGVFGGTIAEHAIKVGRAERVSRPVVEDPLSAVLRRA